MCELARSLVNHGRLINIATFSTRDFQEQGHKSFVASYQVNEELVMREYFLANYGNEGDSRKFSSADNSQYTVDDGMLMKNRWLYDATSSGFLGSQVVYLYCV